MIEFPDKEIHYKFKNTFGIDLFNFKDIIVMMATRKFSFDIIAFNDYCQKHFSYSINKHGSLKDFLTKEFSQEASDLIVYLLEF